MLNLGVLKDCYGPTSVVGLGGLKPVTRGFFRRVFGLGGSLCLANLCRQQPSLPWKRVPPLLKIQTHWVSKEKRGSNRHFGAPLKKRHTLRNQLAFATSLGRPHIRGFSRVRRRGADLLEPLARPRDIRWHQGLAGRRHNLVDVISGLPVF